MEELKVARSIPEQKAAQKQVPTYKAKVNTNCRRGATLLACLPFADLVIDKCVQMLKLEELQEKVLLPPAYETFRLGIEKWSFPGQRR